MACKIFFKIYTFFLFFIHTLHTLDSGISEDESQADGGQKIPGFVLFHWPKYLNVYDRVEWN